MDIDNAVDEDYWISLLEYVDKFYESLDSLDYALYDDYHEPLNDRTDDV